MATKHSIADVAAKAASEAQIAERLRVSSILESAEGQRNPAMARQMINMGMDAPSAISLLANVPAAESPYVKFMDHHAPVALKGATVGGPKDPLTPFDAKAEAKAARLEEIRQNIKNTPWAKKSGKAQSNE